MPGHNPHRPEGKVADMEHARRASVQRKSEPKPEGEPPVPQESEAMEPRGGSRPGVPRRMMGELDEE